MSKFDTHGGYFAPKDYMKVEAGGSHEENPNGGVQIGVDQEGTPNLLEEGEPVYKDYVYSDNIKASERFLKENNIPEKYAGELYSKIADSFFSEAENRPYDPISRNGLEAMLGRLADAQEGQKAYNEQRQLERELKSLSPDELAALEEMLAAGEQQAMEQPVATADPMQPEMMQQPMMTEQQMAPEQMPMMRNGGCLGKKYEVGGPTRIQSLLQSPTMVQAMTGNPSTYATSGTQIPRVESTVGDELGYLVDVATAPAAVTSPLLTGAVTAGEIADVASDGVESSAELAKLTPIIVSDSNEVMLAKNAAGRYTDATGKLLSKADVAEIQAWAEANKSAKLNTAAKSKIGKNLLKDGLLFRSWHPTTKVGKASKVLARLGTGAAAWTLADKTLFPLVGDLSEGMKAARESGVATDTPEFANGGYVNKFDGEEDSQIQRPFVGWQTTHFGMPNPGYSPTNIAYTLYPTYGGRRRGNYDPNVNIDYAWKNGYMWPNDSYNINLDTPVVSGELVDYHPKPESKTQKRVPFSSDLQSIIDATAAQAQVDVRNNLDGLNLKKGPEIVMPVGHATSNRYSDGLLYPADEQIGATPTSSTSTDNDVTVNGNSYLSTFPRYAGAISSGLLGLYNAFQKPDEYTATRYKPFTPSGRISLQDQVYNPIDQNMMMNQVLAQGNSAQRALRNSGLGPSTAAAMVAQDNNITGNLGNTFLQTWDANNQRRSQVIAANNQNEAQRAQFDYAIDAARQKALSDAQMRNAYTDLQIQQLNNAAEGEKYAAVSNQISNALQALSGIGQENFAMNQVNSNPANEGYGILGGGIGAYLPYYYRRNYKCGGKKK